MRWITALVGSLVGLIPLLLLLAVGRVFGLDESSLLLYVLVGTVLWGGVITGGVLGFRMHHRFANHKGLVVITGLAMILVLIGFPLLYTEEYSNPILDAENCKEVYVGLGGSDPANGMALPDDLSPEEIRELGQKLILLQEESPNDPICDRLQADLEEQQSRP